MSYEDNCSTLTHVPWRWHVLYPRSHIRPFPRAGREAGFHPPCPSISTGPRLPGMQSYRLWGTRWALRERNEMPMCTIGKGPGWWQIFLRYQSSQSLWPLSSWLKSLFLPHCRQASHLHTGLGCTAHSQGQALTFPKTWLMSWEPQKEIWAQAEKGFHFNHISGLPSKPPLLPRLLIFDANRKTSLTWNPIIFIWWWTYFNVYTTGIIKHTPFSTKNLSRFRLILSARCAAMGQELCQPLVLRRTVKANPSPQGIYSLLDPQ